MKRLVELIQEMAALTREHAIMWHKKNDAPNEYYCTIPSGSVALQRLTESIKITIKDSELDLPVTWELMAANPSYPVIEDLWTTVANKWTEAYFSDFMDRVRLVD